MQSITFEFVGGPQDGQISYGTLGDASDAERSYLVTNRGSIGQRFRVASEYAIETLAEEQLKDDRPHGFQTHTYVVTDRLEDEHEVRVRAEYLPDSPRPGQSLA